MAALVESLSRWSPRAPGVTPRILIAQILGATVLVAMCMMTVARARDVAPTTDLGGSWVGSWKSCSTGHAGPLRATFTRCGDTQYHVKFSGRFLKVVPFRYTVMLEVVEDRGDSVVLAGSSYLGRLFGTFAYTATADGRSFVAEYTSAKDRGQFRLERRYP